MIGLCGGRSNALGNARECCFLLVLVLSALPLAAKPPATVQLDTKHWLVRGDSRELDRKKYFNVHGTPRELSDAERDLLVNELRVSFGRSLGRISGVFRRAGEDPTHPGHANLRELSKSPVSRTTSDDASDLVESSHPFAFLKRKGESSEAGRFVPANAQAAAEAASAYLKNHPTPPRYFEVINEPNVHLGEYETSWEDVCELHAAVAKRVREDRLGVLVGGPAAAYPAFELKDFFLWEKHMGPFVRNAGPDLDFLSVHLYTTHWDDKVNYRYGANNDAILDLMANESSLSRGGQKPFLISECGRGFRKGEAIHDEYSPQRDWLVISGANHMMFGLYRRDHELLKAIPFIVLKATWYQAETPYPWVLFHRGDDSWNLTHLAKWYRFWRDAEGRHVPIAVDDQQIQAMAFGRGRDLQVYLDNLSQTEREVSFPVEPGFAQSMQVRRLYSGEDGPVLEEETLDAGSSITITMRPEEAVMIRLRLTEPMDPQKEFIESTHYGDRTLAKLDNGKAEVEIELPSTDAAISSAVLRLGLSRSRELSQRPTVRVNGVKLGSSPISRGDGQTLQPDRFGVIEYAVPAKLLLEKNRVEVAYDTPGGRLATVALNVRRERAGLSVEDAGVRAALR